MAYKVKREKSEEEETRELEEFVAQQKERRSSLLKRVGIIVVCVALVIAFCLPGVLPLLMR